MFKKLFALLLTLSVFQCNLAIASAINNKDKKMDREEICKENFHKLFKGNALTNTGDDPEMMAILQKYIFGEVFTIGELDMKTREMLTVVSLTAQQTLPQLKAHINAALNVGVKPLELREAIYQCAPFIGFPKTLNALAVLNEVFKERGIKTPLQTGAQVKENERFTKGSAIQKPLYGDEIKDSLKGLPDNMGEDVARLLTEVCFGDFYTRAGLDTKTRELLVIGVLTTTGDSKTLKSHILGNVMAGNTEAEITAAIIQVMPYTGFPNALEALRTVKDALAK